MCSVNNVENCTPHLAFSLVLCSLSPNLLIKRHGRGGAHSIPSSGESTYEHAAHDPSQSNANYDPPPIDLVLGTNLNVG